MSDEWQWWKKCPICETEISVLSESGKIGACSQCRDTIIPTHIPDSQQKLYIKLYLEEKL